MAIINMLGGGSGDVVHLGFDEPVTVIESSAFANAKMIRRASFEECIEIGNRAFSGCASLNEAYFPVCTTMGSSVFIGCSNLSEIYLPECVSIGAAAFQSARGYLYLGKYSESLYSIYSIFGKTSTNMSSTTTNDYIQIDGIEIPSMVTIPSYAFYCASRLKTAKAVNCTSVSMSAFYGCSQLSEVSIPMCTNIGTSAFAICGIQNIELSYCTQIDAGAFASASLINGSFPVCQTISNGAFRQTTGYIYLGSYSGTINSLFNKSLNSSNYTYVSLTGIEIPKASRIQTYAFYSASLLQTVKAETCTSIGTYAFYNCSLLQNVSLPVCSSITSNAFYGCIALNVASFPSATNIQNSGFMECTALESFYLFGLSLCTLQDSRAFNSTPMMNSTYTGNYGSFYVPSELLPAYKTATNWTYFSDRMVGVDPADYETA